ncbi:AAA family ATPase [Knoellia locipacati]|uniref:AAA family ATPase n=1 Tax=Knoellia locipacati TaxID=882824 RepID=UPI003850EADE
MGGPGARHRSLGERLVELRQFVGRAAELDLVRAALDADEPPFAVLFLHGPGGIGKSSLLDLIAEGVSHDGATVVRLDGAVLAPTPEAVLSKLADSLEVPVAFGAITCPSGRLVLLIDDYERLAPLDGWVQTALLPRLPASALTVIAGRTPPEPRWRSESSWSELLRVVSLRNLSPAESREYLRAVGVASALHDEVVSATHGHPLALSLLADVVLREGAVPPGPLPPDLVSALLGRFVEDVPTDLHRRALQVCGLARTTTEPLLRDALGLEDARELFDWLRGLSFVTAGQEGLFPHDLARDVIDAELRWRDPEEYRTVFRGVWTHTREHLRSAVGWERRQAVFDLKFVFRNLPGVLAPVDWTSWGGLHPEPAKASDRDVVLELVLDAEGLRSREIAARWWERQREGFWVLRHHNGSVLGMLVLLDLTRASPDDITSDPGATAAWDHAQHQSPTRPGEVVTQTRFIIDKHAYQNPSATLNAAPLLTMEHYMRTKDLAWDFLTLAEPDRWNDYFAVADLPRAEGADFRVGDRTYGLFAHDFRRVPVDDWLQLVTERSLARDVSPAPPTKSEFLVLSQPEFAQAVKQALRDMRRPALLDRNPLTRTRLVHDQGSAGPGSSGAALETLLRDAVDALANDPRDDALLRAVDRTYLRPAVTQEAAATLLGLPFSTYRRHLTRGVRRIVDWLWERELYGPGAFLGAAGPDEQN